MEYILDNSYVSVIQKFEMICCNPVDFKAKIQFYSRNLWCYVLCIVFVTKNTLKNRKKKSKVTPFNRPFVRGFMIMSQSIQGLLFIRF